MKCHLTLMANDHEPGKYIQPRANPSVVTYGMDGLCKHEAATHTALAKQIAALKGHPFAGNYECDMRERYRSSYFAPSRTILVNEAQELGLRCDEDLYGGVVPAEFIATKAISHPLVDPRADAPSEWSCEFAAHIRPFVHGGCTVFSLRDAQRVGQLLVQIGPVRVKPTRAKGSGGQTVITKPAELMAILTDLDETEIQTSGLVFEENLTEVRTWSVGECRLAGLQIAYLGTQRLTSNHEGEAVYGGSDLYLVPGDIDTLLRHNLSDSARLAVQQARSFDLGVREFYPMIFASRRNYDVAQGTDWRGIWRSGVLEQSWRIGGATSAELIAFAAFRIDPDVPAIRASSVEVYADAPAIPPGATIYFQGVDARCGPMTKYAIRHADP
jgi:hypothetical protein